MNSNLFISVAIVCSFFIVGYVESKLTLTFLFIDLVVYVDHLLMKLETPHTLKLQKFKFVNRYSLTSNRIK